VAVGKVEASYLGDYDSLRPLSCEVDELGDDNHARAARDLETVDYWRFHADRGEESDLKPRALFELGRMHQLGLYGSVQVSLRISLRFKGLFLYTVGVLFRVRSGVLDSSGLLVLYSIVSLA